jgi:ribonuclease HI
MKCAKLEYRRNSNKDLWLEYEKARNNRKINWNWIKAHNGNYLNEYVDSLAREEAEFLKK